jgi:hypothetical protein
MKYVIGVLVFCGVIACACVLFAQTPVDPSGHWVGAITLPAAEMSIEVDLTRTAAGAVEGTFGRPDRQLRGLRLARVVANGRAISFAIKNSKAGEHFQGILFADGQTISGEVTSSLGTAPFSLTRDGDARVTRTRVSAPLSGAIEGRWSGAATSNGTSIRVGLVMTNNTDGTSSGMLITAEGMEIGVTSIAQDGARVAIDLSNLGATYAGTLNEGATQLAGTFTQGEVTMPLVFERATMSR